MEGDLAAGGLAVTSDALKGDCRVSVLPGDGIRIRSSVQAMYGDSIHELAAQSWKSFGAPGIRIEIDDGGALPCVLRARLEAALSEHTQQSLPALSISDICPQRDRRRRTRLYIPAHTPRLFLNASVSDADMVIFDLEDAVPASQKAGARSLVRHVVSAIDWGKTEPAVRINSGIAGQADLAATCQAGVHLFLIPKVESAKDVTKVAEVLDQFESPALLLPLVESALGVENAFEIVRASPRIAAVSLGIEDLVLDLGAQRTASQVETAYARGRLVNAARAAGVQPLASVFPRFDDAEDVKAYAASARQMGYEGIGCIHPSQIRPAHQALAPSSDEIAWAKSVTARGQADEAASALQGAMVDAPVFRRALRILQEAGGQR